MQDLKELPCIIGHTVSEIEAIFGNETHRTLEDTLEIELSEGTLTCIFCDNRCCEVYLFANDGENCSPVCILFYQQQKNQYMATVTLNNGLELTDKAQEFLKEIQDDTTHYLEELIAVNDFIVFHESENPSGLFDGMGLLFFLQQMRDVVKKLEKKQS